MVAGGLEISSLRGTPLYELAKNANVYGGKTLSKSEMVFFQQQAREMGFNLSDYGLEIVSEDIEGESFKETKKNSDGVQNYIQKSYESQFGKKNNAVRTAQDAETKAYAMIKVAKDAFVRNHRGVEFYPKQLGNKPNFMAPEYKNNLTKYVSDLNAWAQDVAHGYNDADSLSNEQLAQLIMANDNMNTGAVIANDNENAGLLSEEIDSATQAIVGEVGEQGEETRKAVHNEGAATRSAVHQEGAATRNAIYNEADLIHMHIDDAAYGIHEHIDDATNYLGKEIQKEGEKTRRTVKDEGWSVRETVRKDGARTRGLVKESAQQTQELNGISEKITVNLSNVSYFHTQSTMDSVNNMRNKILQSNAPFEIKRELLTHLAAFSTQVVMNDLELTQEEKLINDKLNQ